MKLLLCGLSTLIFLTSSYGAAALPLSDYRVASKENNRPTHRVVFHVDSGADGTFSKVVSNIENLRRDPRLKDGVEIELLANSSGAQLLLNAENPFADRIESLARAGVVLAICGNTLRSLELKQEDLIAGAIVVPSGVGELVIRQTEGWAYIHPTK